MQQPRRWQPSLTAALWVSLLVPGWALADELKPAPLDVQADRLELDQRDGTARFEGNVRARQDAFLLSCERLVARYDEKGKLKSLHASGKVEVRGEGLMATAERADYDHVAGFVELAGDPKVVRGLDRVSGNVIRYWPEAQRLVIEGAKGQFALPAAQAVGRQ